MRVIVNVLLLVSFLASCGTPPKSPYHDTGDLERPPRVANSSPPQEEGAADKSPKAKKKHSVGLGDQVYLRSPSQLIIRQPFEDAWSTLARAFRQSGVKMTDHERDKGVYYVTYEHEASGFFEKMSSFFSSDTDTTIYLLTVKPEGVETTVTANIANATEQSSAAKEAAMPPPVKGAEKLLELLFETLRDKLEEK